jgi:hypothetical protein
MPKSRLSKWSVWLVPVMVLLFFVGSSLAASLYHSVPAGETIFKDIINRPVLALSMFSGFSAGVAAFITGLISIIKHQQRGVLVLISTLIGAAVTLFLVGEFLL